MRACGKQKILPADFTNFRRFIITSIFKYLDGIPTAFFLLKAYIYISTKISHQWY